MVCYCHKKYTAPALLACLLALFRTFSSIFFSTPFAASDRFSFFLAFPNESASFRSSARLGISVRCGNVSWRSWKARTRLNNDSVLSSPSCFLSLGTFEYAMAKRLSLSLGCFGLCLGFRPCVVSNAATRFKVQVLGVSLFFACNRGC